MNHFSDLPEYHLNGGLLKCCSPRFPRETPAEGFGRQWLWLFLALASASSSVPAMAEDSGNMLHRDKPMVRLGDSFKALAAHGLKLGLTYTGEMARVDGGNETSNVYLDNTSLTLEADLHRIFNLADAKMFIQVLGNSGGSPSEYAGDLQVVSNIDAPDSWKLYEMWYEKNWHNQRFSLKAGLYDLNSEFDVADTSQLFINSSFGIGAEIAQTGENGPSIFPTTALSIRGRMLMNDQFYLQTAVLDGVAGDPDKPHGTRIRLDGDDGLLLAAEVGYESEAASGEDGLYRKFALGTWRYTSSSETDAAGMMIAPRENRGFYALVESRLTRERDDPEQGLAGFLRYGIADDRINQLDAYFGAGLVYTGLLPGRVRDQLGLALAHAQISDHFRRQRYVSGGPVEAGETTLELTYHMQLVPWLALQPDYQLVIDPGANPTLDDAQVFTLRFEIAF